MNSIGQIPDCFRDKMPHMAVFANSYTPIALDVYLTHITVACNAQGGEGQPDWGC